MNVSRPGPRTSIELGFWTQCLTVFIADVETHFAQAKTNGAEILEEPQRTVYGEFQNAAKDLDGHLGLFSRHAQDQRGPETWGATIVNPLSCMTSAIRATLQCSRRHEWRLINGCSAQERYSPLQVLLPEL